MAEVQGRPLDWDMGSAQASEGKSPKLAPGIYPFEVTWFDPKRYEGGRKIGPCPMARITVNITGTELDGGGIATITRQEDLKLWDSEFCRGLIGAFFRSIGAPKNPDGTTVVTWDRDYLVGKSGFCEVDLHDYEKDGQIYKANGIVKFLDPEKVGSNVGPFDVSAMDGARAAQAEPAVQQAYAAQQPAYAPQPQAYQPQQMPPEQAYAAVQGGMAGAQPARGF